MNKVILMGRATRNAEARYTSGENSMCITRYTLAVDRKFKRDGQDNTEKSGCRNFTDMVSSSGKMSRQQRA